MNRKVFPVANSRQSARAQTSRARDTELGPREQLLAATSQLMTERATADVSFSDIAERSGLNSALIKYYFGNKSGLLMALVRSAIGESMAQIQTLLGMDVPAKEKLRLHIAGIINVYYRHPYLNRLIHHFMNEGGETYGPAVAEEIIKPLTQAQQVILREGVANGEFREVDPVLFYMNVVGACDHLFLGQYTLKYGFGVKKIDDEFRQRYAEHVYDLALNGIQA